MALISRPKALTQPGFFACWLLRSFTAIWGLSSPLARWVASQTRPVAPEPIRALSPVTFAPESRKKSRATT